MAVKPVPARLPHPALPGADWADRYEVVVPCAKMSAETAARRLFTRMPRWARQLLALRNVLVAPLGLKGASEENGPAPGDRRIGIFPIVSNKADEIVLGFDDRHLDFRVVVDTSSPEEETTRVGLQTVIRRHNFAGRAYLALIMPFHKAIVSASLRHLAENASDDGRV
ncbi:MAG: hypothetical protein CML30_18050 [Rhizobiales bacterium]|nr:hypothetical protein [Hyphomicrobiales bacterium]|tara:strand:+ start:122 stop:625 length:504 start_codon:yes stop_codon:yes gene_type:complete